MLPIKMEISIILAHPDPRSFNHAIASTVGHTLESKGHTVLFHDLYAEKFDPLLTIAELNSKTPPPAEVAPYCDELGRADGIVIVHPNWWGQPPAILKGWVDRVVRQGVAYKFAVNENGEFGPVGLLRAQAALVLNTSNTPLEYEMRAFGDPLDNLWKRCTLEYCGIQKVLRQNFGPVIVSSAEERAVWLRQVEELTAASFQA
jgi:putative NADPH-quinone reductase